jgi:hypothetical protein
VSSTKTRARSKRLPLAELDEAVAALDGTKAARDRALVESKRLFREAQEHFDADRAAAREVHRDANRALLKAIDRANAAGMAKGDIARHLGLSPQFVLSLRRKAKEWGDEEAAEKELRRLANDPRVKANPRLAAAVAEFDGDGK